MAEMTPEERARALARSEKIEVVAEDILHAIEVLSDLSRQARLAACFHRVDQAIREAVEAEREACARAVEEKTELGVRVWADQFGTKIAAVIRARSKADD